MSLWRRIRDRIAPPKPYTPPPAGEAGRLIVTDREAESIPKKDRDSVTVVDTSPGAVDRIASGSSGGGRAPSAPSRPIDVATGKPLPDISLPKIDAPTERFDSRTGMFVDANARGTTQVLRAPTPDELRDIRSAQIRGGIFTDMTPDEVADLSRREKEAYGLFKETSKELEKTGRELEETGRGKIRKEGDDLFWEGTDEELDRYNLLLGDYRRQLSDIESIEGVREIQPSGPLRPGEDRSSLGESFLSFEPTTVGVKAPLMGRSLFEMETTDLGTTPGKVQLQAFSEGILKGGEWVGSKVGKVTRKETEFLLDSPLGKLGMGLVEGREFKSPAYFGEKVGDVIRDPTLLKGYLPGRKPEIVFDLSSGETRKLTEEDLRRTRVIPSDQLFTIGREQILDVSETVGKTAGQIGLLSTPVVGTTYFGAMVEKGIRPFDYDVPRFIKEQPLQAGILGGILALKVGAKGYSAFKSMRATQKQTAFQDRLLQSQKDYEIFKKRIAKIQADRQRLTRGETGFRADEFGRLTGDRLTPTSQIGSFDLTKGAKITAEQQESLIKFYMETGVAKSRQQAIGLIKDVRAGRVAIETKLPSELTLIGGSMGDVAKTVQLPKLTQSPFVGASKGQLSVVSTGIKPAGQEFSPMGLPKELTKEFERLYPKVGGAKEIAFVSPITKTGKVSKVGEYQVITTTPGDKFMTITPFRFAKRARDVKVSGQPSLKVREVGFIESPKTVVKFGKMEVTQKGTPIKVDKEMLIDGKKQTFQVDEYPIKVREVTATFRELPQVKGKFVQPTRFLEETGKKVSVKEAKSLFVKGKTVSRDKIKDVIIEGQRQPFSFEVVGRVGDKQLGAVSKKTLTGTQQDYLQISTSTTTGISPTGLKIPKFEKPKEVYTSGVFKGGVERIDTKVKPVVPKTPKVEIKVPKIEKVQVDKIKLDKPSDSIYAGTGQYETQFQTVFQPSVQIPAGRLVSPRLFKEAITQPRTTFKLQVIPLAGMKTGTQFQPQVLATLQPQVETQFQTQVQPQVMIQPQLQVEQLMIQPQVETQIKPMTQAKVMTQIKPMIQTQMKQISQLSLAKISVQKTAKPRPKPVKKPLEPKPILKPIIIKSDRLTFSDKKKIEDEEDFGVFVRKKGEDIEIGQFGTIKEAKSKLKSELTETLRASGFITKKGKPIDFNGGTFGTGFRRSKTDPFRIVERKGRRIKKGTGEVAEILKSRGSFL
jgi:hypothetical protein